MIMISNDSAHSQRSTVTVEDIKQPAHIEADVTPARRSVRIAECNNEYFDNTMRCAEDCAETWYTSADYKAFKQAYRQAMSNDTNEKYTAIRAMYLACRKVNFILEDASELSNASEVVSQVAALYNDNMDAMVGFESNLVSSIKKDMRQKREAIQDVVFDIQLECEKGLWEENSEEMQNELYESCINYTQTCGLFAQLLAKALAEA